MSSVSPVKTLSEIFADEGWHDDAKDDSPDDSFGDRGRKEQVEHVGIVFIDPSTASLLDSFSATTGHPAQEIVVTAIREHIERMGR